MECQVNKNEQIWHLLLFAFNQDSKAAKCADFYQRGVENLVERLEKVVDNNGEYIID